MGTIIWNDMHITHEYIHGHQCGHAATVMPRGTIGPERQLSAGSVHWDPIELPRRQKSLYNLSSARGIHL